MQGCSGKEDGEAEGRDKAAYGGEAPKSEGGAYPTLLPSADDVKSPPSLLETEAARALGNCGPGEPQPQKEGVKRSVRFSHRQEPYAVRAAKVDASRGLVLRAGGRPAGPPAHQRRTKRMMRVPVRVAAGREARDDDEIGPGKESPSGVLGFFVLTCFAVGTCDLTWENRWKKKLDFSSLA